MANSSTGTTLAVSVTAPATHDAAGFAALTWTDVGDVSDFGEPGGTTEVLEFVPVETGIKEKFLGVQDNGGYDFVIARDSAAAGQTILTDAYDNRTQISQRVTLPDGDIQYTRCFVASRPINIGSASNVLTISVNSVISGAIVEVIV